VAMDKLMMLIQNHLMIEITEKNINQASGRFTALAFETTTDLASQKNQITCI